jgi:hypothetical protein
VVIGTQLVIYSLAGEGACGQRAMESKPIVQICTGTMEQMHGGFDSTLNLLLAEGDFDGPAYTAIMGLARRNTSPCGNAKILSYWHRITRWRSAGAACAAYVIWVRRHPFTAFR